MNDDMNEMKHEEKQILCKKCGTDKFVVRESVLGAFSLGCAECGEGYIFGTGLTARDILFILKGEDKKIV